MQIDNYVGKHGKLIARLRQFKSPK